MDTFFMPTQVLFGLSVIPQNHSLFHKSGSKAFIVTGKHSAVESGAQADVLAALASGGIDYYIFSEVTENPALSIVERGAGILGEEKCDFIIAIGGGSPIDAGKAIAILASNDIAPEDIYIPSRYDKALPLIAVPTTSGTGTEVTHYSVITNDKTNTKAGFGTPLIFPRYSFCDPKYTLTLSVTATQDTGIDALSHLLEGVYSNKRNPLLMPLIYKGIEYIFDNLNEAMFDRGNLEARTRLMQASLWGGMVIAHTSTTLQHSIGYPVTTEFGISHGLANGIFMKPIMDLYHHYIENEIEEIFSRIGISRMDFYLWLRDQGLQSPKLKITEQFIADKTPEVLASRNMALNPCPITKADIEKLYRDVMKQ